jgi:D-serine deaminase-like pyridoxal phosphate-dependent protein
MTCLLQHMETPALLLDEGRTERNVERMRRQVQRLGVTFRPHVKTNKCIEVARRTMTSP